MDAAEKKVFLVSILILASFFFAILAANKWLNAGIPECIPRGEVFEEGKVEQIDDNTWQIFYLARMWDFEPHVVTLPKGAEVDLYLTSSDVIHGFDINHTHVNMMAVPGTVNKMTYTFNKPGVFHITCHEYCGSGHQNMDAQIIIK